jgi:hypothetical protein
VSLVEQHQTVVGRQPREDRCREVAPAVTAEQEPRAELVDGRRDDRRLRRQSGPSIVAEHTAAEPRNGKRALGSRKLPQPIRDFPQRAVFRGGELARDLLRTIERPVHHDAPIDDEPDTPRGGALLDAFVCLHRQRK